MHALDKFEEAIRLTGADTRAKAVMAICEHYVNARHAEMGGISLQ